MFFLNECDQLPVSFRSHVETFQCIFGKGYIKLIILDISLSFLLFVCLLWNYNNKSSNEFYSYEIWGLLIVVSYVAYGFSICYQMMTLPYYYILVPNAIYIENKEVLLKDISDFRIYHRRLSNGLIKTNVYFRADNDKLWYLIDDRYTGDVQKLIRCYNVERTYEVFRRLMEGDFVRFSYNTSIHQNKLFFLILSKFKSPKLRYLELSFTSIRIDGNTYEMEHVLLVESKNNYCIWYKETQLIMKIKKGLLFNRKLFWNIFKLIKTRKFLGRI